MNSLRGWTLRSCGQPFGLRRPQPPDRSRHGFAVQIVADEVARQPIAAVDGVPGRGRPVDHRSIRQARARQPCLNVANQVRRGPHDLEVRLELIGRGEVAVVHRELEITRQAAGAVLEPYFAVVVLRHAPLRRARPGRFADDAVRRPADAKRIDGAVQPVVHGPHQVRRLRLEAAAAPEARGEEVLPVGDAVLVRVGVFPHLVFVGFGGQDRIRTERHGEAREEEAVDEHRVVFERPVTVAILVRGDAAGRHDRVDAVGRLFVAAQFDDEHAAVAVEGDLAW